MIGETFVYLDLEGVDVLPQTDKERLARIRFRAVQKDRATGAVILTVPLATDVPWGQGLDHAVEEARMMLRSFADGLQKACGKPLPQSESGQ